MRIFLIDFLPNCNTEWSNSTAVGTAEANMVDSSIISGCGY